MRVKICGVTRPEDAEAAASAGADMVGLNFYPRSRRFVEHAAAREIAAAIPDGVWRVGVFVNATREEIARTRSAVGLAAIQLHGDEPPELLTDWPCPVIRALRLRSRDDADRALAEHAPDYFLCEGGAAGDYGGRGETFDWEWARSVPAESLIVVGGLDPTNVADVVRRLRPFAVDVASGVESSPGIKDVGRMRELIHNAKTA